MKRDRGIRENTREWLENIQTIFNKNLFSESICFVICIVVCVDLISAMVDFCGDVILPFE